MPALPSRHVFNRLRTGFALRCKVMAYASVGGLAVPGLIAVLQDSWQTLQWLLDLAVHWQLLYASVLVLSALMLVGLTRRIHWLALAVIAGAPWLTASSSAPPALPGTPATISVAEANIYYDNKDPQRVFQWIRAADVDVAVLLEVSPAFSEQLKSLSSHPNQHVIPRTDGFGIAIVSRLPFDRKEIKALDFGEEVLQARLTKNGKSFALTAMHPVPPLMAPKYQTARDAGIRRLTHEAAASGTPELVIGDLNATPWSSAFRDVAGLRRTTALRPTWHSLFQGWMGIPIDHVLATRHWQVVEESRGPYIGSDHYPVVVRLSLTPESPSP